MRLLRDLTAGRFRDGAVARVIAMDFWTRGKAPTFEEFARSWTKAKAQQHRLLTPEYAYLTDLRSSGARIARTERWWSRAGAGGLRNTPKHGKRFWRSPPRSG
jgi:hypothetical protein